MTPLASKVLDVAVAELGVHEEPPRSNRGPRVDEYIRAAGLDPEAGAYPWCAAFVCWCVRQAGRELAIKPQLRFSAGVLRLLERNPEAVLDRPEAGAIFIHLKPNETGHTGLVLGVNDDLSIATIEGNSDASGSRTGGMVVQHRRPASYVSAYLVIQ